MNSRVSVDAEPQRELRRGVGGVGGGEEEPQDDFEASPSLPCDGQGGNVVLVLPPKDNMMADPSTSDDCIPLIVNNVPVFISHTSNGSPLYIRQYPPTLEEIMVRSPEDLIANFDGFSEASGQTFEGFSETSCNSVLFEGFSEEAANNPRFSVARNLGTIVSEGALANDLEDYWAEHKVPCESKLQKKSALRSSRSGSHKRKSTYVKDSPGGTKGSSTSSSQMSPQKRAKQEGTAMKTEKEDRSGTSRNKHLPSQHSETVMSPRAARQSTDKQENEPDTSEELLARKPRNMPSPEDPDYIGEHCNEVGCTVAFLERMSIKDVKVNNGIVQELSDFATQISWEKEFVVRWIQRLSGAKTELVEDDDLKSIQAVLKRRKALAIIHSGNQYVKSKIKSFDDAEFVLPSVAKRKGTINEAGSMAKPVASNASESATHTTSHPEVNYEKEEVIRERAKEKVVVKKEEERRELRRGLKRIVDEEEVENKRVVREKRTARRANEKEEYLANKVAEKKVTKGEVGEKRMVDRTRRDQRTSMINKQEKEEQITERNERKVSTRRASMALAREEKEKQAIEKEKPRKGAEETKKDRGNHRRTSIVLKDEGEQGSEKIEEKQATPRKKKNQASNQEEDSKSKRHGKQPKDEEEHKQLVDRKKERRTACIETDQTAEMEEGAGKTTEKETAGARGGMSTRRASMILARQEKEKLATENGEAKQTTEKTETARNYNTRRSRGASITIRSQEDEQSNDQNKEEQAAYKDREVRSSKTHERQTMDNNSQVTPKEKEADRRGSDETTEKEKQAHVSDKQIVNETQTERRVSSRRASLIARQEKQKHVTEVQEAKQVTDRIVGEYKRDRRVSSRRSSLTMAMKQEEEKEDADGEKEKETASRADRETRRGRRASRRESLSIMKQDKHEGGKETTEEGQAKGDGNVKTEKLNSVRTKEVAGENLRASPEESKQTIEKEEEVSKTQYNYKEKQSRKKEQNGEKEEAPTSVEGEKDDAKRSKELQIMGINNEDQIILKRNKVINRDKRISRWQNRKLGRHAEDNQDKRIFSKVPLAIKSSPSSSEVREYMKSEQSSSREDTLSDESDGNLVIDEGDSSIQSDVSENNLIIDEGDTNVQDEPSHRMPKENKVSVAQSDGRSPVSVSEGKQKKKRKLTIEDSLLNKTTDSPQQRQTIRRKKEECEKATVVGETDTPESSVLAEEGEDSQKSHDSGIVEESPQVAAVHVSPEASPKPQGTPSSFSSTLGVSKSGRLRKASAKGIQSIEIKCLFMQNSSEAPRPPPPLPVLKNERQDKDWVQEKRSPVKYDHKNKESMQERKTSVSAKVRKESVFKKTDTEHLSYTTREGHLVPTFKETDYYLGDFCFKAGVTVDDLNSDKMMEVKMTFGMIKELHDFYMSRKATKTALAVRLFKMSGKKFLDNTHLLSTVIRITTVGAMKYTDKERLSREFVLPNRITYHGPPEGEEETRQAQNLQDSEVPKTPPADAPPAIRVRRTVKKRGFKPEDSGDEEFSDYDGIKEDRESYNEILLTRGQKGSITRGDIVHLYSTWLKSKMSLGSNTFVTDLLRSVEQLMAERDIAPIRIPAGTLMSSSVKLHDEYQQILSISKEDAVMYLEEDWLEDIKYLLSISGPSRRSTTEGEASLGGAGEGDNSATSEKYMKGKTGRCRSGSQKEEEVTDFEGEPLSNTTPFKGIHKKVDSVSHHMESVGKRLGKRRSIRESLQEYERDILLELEKVGVLEEEEEDILTQLEREKGMPKDEKVEGKKNVEREKGKDYDKDTQKKVAPNKKGMKPVADRNFDCEVDKILDYQEIHDNKGKHLRYLIRWVGSGPKGDSWVDETSLQCPEKLKEFWNRKKKTPRRDKPQPAVEKDCKSPRETGQSKPESLLKDPKDGEESLVQVMVKHGSAQHATNANKELPLVTKRELLNLYDIWRQENQDDLMAGSSNTVNVEVFKGRVRNLMASRNVEFYPESLLNACFMMTLMKTRLQSKMSIDKFLDSSCMEVLESSHRQYLKGKYYQLGEAPSSKCPKEQKHSILSLQNELHSLRLDLTTAQKWRAVKNSQLGAVEEEVDCLKTAMNISNIKKKTKKILYFKQELQKLRSDIKILERNQRPEPNDKDAKKIKVPIFGEIIRDSEKYKRNRKIVRNKLLYMNISERAVNTIMNVVAQRVASELVQE